MLLIIFLACLVVFSFLATLISLIFMLSPESYQRLEDFLSLEFGSPVYFNTTLEGKINILNDWVLQNRMVFGPLLAVLAALNTRNIFFFLNLRP